MLSSTCVCVCFLIVGLVFSLAHSGLGSIVECWTVDGRCSEALYLCEVCVLRLSKADVRNHITGSLHRYNYIVRIRLWISYRFCCTTSCIEGLFFFLCRQRARHPHLVSKWKDDADLCELAWPLMEMAKTLESEEGPGDIQVFLFFFLHLGSLPPLPHPPPPPAHSLSVAVSGRCVD